jgi:hypothetical protein
LGNGYIEHLLCQHVTSTEESLSVWIDGEDVAEKIEPKRWTAASVCRLRYSPVSETTPLAMMMFNGRYAMAPESIWPGMFQAEAGRGDTTSVRRTRDATSATVASYAISDEQGARKKVLDKRQWTAVNRRVW